MDQYRVSELDENDYDEVDPIQRAAAEKALNQRDGIDELPEAFEFISGKFFFTKKFILVFMLIIPHCMLGSHFVFGFGLYK